VADDARELIEAFGPDDAYARQDRQPSTHAGIL
jgi:hypothetical protein